MMEVSHHESEAEVPTTFVGRQDHAAVGVAVSVVDAETMARVDRYRIAFERAQAGPDEAFAEPFESAIDRVLVHLASFGRLAWAVEHPLDPRAALILSGAGRDYREELEDLFAELRRFGEAILTRGDPAKLAAVERRGAIERREEQLLRAAVHEDATEFDIALYWVRILDARLQLLSPKQRATVLARLRRRAPRKPARH
jgi:hypothetical protein